MSANHHFLPFALHGQHLNVGQVLMGAIQAGNGGFVRVRHHTTMRHVVTPNGCSA